MGNNSNLHRAKKQKNDEFYTQLADIEAEMKHYTEHFKGKTIYCNCDNPEWSNFWKFFVDHFHEYGLRKLISTHFNIDGSPTYRMDYDGKDYVKKELQGNGDFRSDECVEALKEADIVVTNPPFSLFRDFMKLLFQYDKKFVVIGHQNAITYKEIFPYIKNNKLWLGYGFKGNVAFFINKFYEDYAKASEHKDGCIRVSGACWFTNIDIDKRHQPLSLTKAYNKQDYPKYDNYDAIEVSKTKNIPFDYDGAMGVPVTWLTKYCPEQFRIIGHEHDIYGNGGNGIKEGQFIANRKGVYKRIIIEYCYKGGKIYNG